MGSPLFLLLPTRSPSGLSLSVAPDDLGMLAVAGAVQSGPAWLRSEVLKGRVREVGHWSA